LNEKGEDDILKVEMEKERGNKVRVVKGMEKKELIDMFKGNMVVN
jgi:hypothetical protein